MAVSLEKFGEIQVPEPSPSRTHPKLSRGALGSVFSQQLPDDFTIKLGEGSRTDPRLGIKTSCSSLALPLTLSLLLGPQLFSHKTKGWMSHFKGPSGASEQSGPVQTFQQREQENSSALAKRSQIPPEAERGKGTKLMLSEQRFGYDVFRNHRLLFFFNIYFIYLVAPGLGCGRRAP